jgi:uncharacterized protein with ACT and thioredoxin-like domain
VRRRRRRRRRGKRRRRRRVWGKRIMIVYGWPSASKVSMGCCAWY